MIDWQARRKPLKWFQLWRLIGWSLVAVVVFLSLTSDPVDLPDVEFSDKIAHAFAYFVLMAWFAQLYLRNRHGWILLALICLGIGLEALQGQSGFRTFDYADMAANSLGAVVAWALAATPFAVVLQWFEGCCVKRML